MAALIIGMLIVALLVCIGITVAITAVLFRFVSSPSNAALIGGLTLPMLVCVWGFYDLATLEVDSPPPGMLLLGGLTFLLAMTPLTLLTSFMMARRQNRRNGN